MTATIAHTNTEKINSILLSHNPFARPPVVNTSDIWNETFHDIESLNSHASDAVFEALRQIKNNQYSTTSILVTAEQGTGKSHLLSRIRRRLWKQGGALFILANEFGDLTDVKGKFQLLLSRSLSNVGSKGVQQWQEIAESIANAAIQSKEPGSSYITAQELIKKLEEVGESEAKSLIKGWVKSFCKKRPVQNRDIIKAILWTLSEEEGSYACNWLAGQEIAQYKANDLLLPSQNKSFNTVIEILDIISDYSEVIICIDELDSSSHNEAGLHISLVIASFAKDLLQNLKRGIILSVMTPDIWSKKIKQLLPAGISDKITTYSNPLNLDYMNGESILELVSLSMADYAESNRLTLPFPIYPFDENVLIDLGRDKPTVRQVWKWCKNNCYTFLEDSDPKTGQIPTSSVGKSNGASYPQSSSPEFQSDPVEDAFSSEIVEAQQADMDNSLLLANALSFSLQKLEGKKVDNVEISKVEEKVKKGKKKDPYLNFKIFGKDKQDVCIGVAILQHDGGQALGAGFKRLLDEKNQFGLTRGCLVRSQQKTISSWIKNKYLKPLIEKGGEFVALTPKEIHPLLAIHSVFRKRESDYDVTEEQITNFILSHGQEKLLGEHNPLLREILSDPSHEVPDLVEEPEAEVIVPETDDDDDADL